MSRAPLREAIWLLKRDGLLVEESARSTRVVQLTEDDVHRPRATSCTASPDTTPKMPFPRRMSHRTPGTLPCMNDKSEQEESLSEQAAYQYESLAEAASEVARTVEMSADVHDQMTGHDPQAAERARDLRRLAAAERTAAAAYLRGEMPSEEVQKTIRDHGRDTTTEREDGPQDTSAG